MNRIIVTGAVSKNPTLFLNGGDINSAQLKFSVADNYYRGKDKELGKNFHNVTLFGEYGVTMAHFIAVGVLVMIDGHLTIYQEESKERKADGKPVKIYHDASITGPVKFMSTSKKSIIAEINKNIAAMVAAGQLPPVMISMGEKLYAPKNDKAPAFNYNTILATGMWGHARVWDKSKGGWIKPIPGTVASPVTPITFTPEMLAQLAAMGLVVTTPTQKVAQATAVQSPVDVAALEHAMAAEEAMNAEIIEEPINLENVDQVGDILG